MRTQLLQVWPLQCSVRSLRGDTCFHAEMIGSSPSSLLSACSACLMLKNHEPKTVTDNMQQTMTSTKELSESFRNESESISCSGSHKLAKSISKASQTSECLTQTLPVSSICRHHNFHRVFLLGQGPQHFTICYPVVKDGDRSKPKRNETRSQTPGRSSDSAGPFQREDRKA